MGESDGKVMLRGWLRERNRRESKKGRRGSRPGWGFLEGKLKLFLVDSQIRGGIAEGREMVSGGAGDRFNKKWKEGEGGLFYVL